MQSVWPDDDDDDDNDFYLCDLQLLNLCKETFSIDFFFSFNYFPCISAIATSGDEMVSFVQSATVQ